MDTEKAFYNIQIQRMLQTMRNNNVSNGIISTVFDSYSRNYAKGINREVSEEVPTNKWIRQGDLLSLMLFGTVMKETIKYVENIKGFRMRPKDFNIMCFADKALLISIN